MKTYRSLISMLLNKRVPFIISILWLAVIFIPNPVNAEKASDFKSFVEQTNPIYKNYNLLSFLTTTVSKQTDKTSGENEIFASIGDSTVEQKWSSALNGAVLFSPLIDNQKNIAYVVSNTKDNATQISNAKLTAINISDGSDKWEFKVDGAIVAKPFIDNNATIYLAVNNNREVNSSNKSATLLALDENGAQKWFLKVAGEFGASPTLGQNGIVFFGTNLIDDASLFAIDPFAVTDTANVKPDWTFNVQGNILSPPLLTERDTIFVGTVVSNEDETGNVNTTGHLYSIGATQGNLKWKFNTPGGIFASPVNNGNLLFAGSSIIINKQEEVSTEGELLAFNIDNINPDNVTPFLSIPLNGALLFSPLIINNNLYFSTLNAMFTIPDDQGDFSSINVPTSTLYAIDITDGSTIWNIDLDSIVASSPSAGPDGSILVSANQIDLNNLSITGNLISFDPNSSIKLNLKTDDLGMLSKPTVDLDGLVYTGTAGITLRSGIIGGILIVDSNSGDNILFETEEGVLSSPVTTINEITNEKLLIFGTGDIKTGEEDGFKGSIVALSIERDRRETNQSEIAITKIEPSTSILGTPVEIEGKIDPAPMSVASVNITISDTTGNVFEQEVFTNTEGNFNLSNLFLPGGSWNINAKWQGNSEFMGATVEQTSTLTVNPADVILETNFPETQLATDATFNITGILTPSPDTPFSRDLLDGIPIKLIRLGPNSEIEALITNTKTTEENIEFEFNNLQLVQPGIWQLIVSFEENSLSFNRSNIETKEVTVTSSSVDKPGYAIIIEGAVESQSGIESHNLTTNLIYGQLSRCGFSDDDIFYFNFNTEQTNVDAIPSKTEILNTVKIWARDKINLLPAPLYIILAGHGETEKFPIFPDVLESGDLASAISDLRKNLVEGANNEKIILTLGFPHSGSFIDNLSETGTVIITSCDSRETSVKGPLAPNDSVRNGDFFLSEFFKQTTKGLSLKNSYEKAAIASMTFSNNVNANGLNGEDAGNGQYSDNAAFHPLLDDNGDKVGTNGQLSALVGNDGAEAAKLVLCANNSDPDSVEIVKILPFVTIEPGESNLLFEKELEVVVSDNSRVGKIWIEVESPGFQLNIDENSTEQITIDLPSFPGEFDPAPDELDYEWSNLDELGFEGFVQGGKYRVFYFVEDNQTFERALFAENNSLSTIIRNNDPENTVPPTPAFGPIGGGIVAGAVIVEENNNNNGNRSNPLTANRVTITADEDALPNDVTYTVLISQDETFNTIDVRIDDLKEKFVIVDSTFGLQLNTEYFWNVIAVSEKGASSAAKESTKVTTSSSGGFPGFVKGVIKEDDTDFPITSASIRLPGRSNTFTTQEDGAYFFELPSGNFTIEAEKSGFKTQKASFTINSFETTTREIRLLKAKEEPPVQGETGISVTPSTAGKSLRMKEAVVTLNDSDNEPIPGVSIIATVNGKRAKVTPSSQITDENGEARFQFKFGLLSTDGTIVFTADGLDAVITQQ